MSDQDDRTPREPDRRSVVDVPPELQPRCRAEVARIRCSRPALHDGPHRTPGGDEWADPPDARERPRWQRARADIALRHTFRAELAPAVARELDRAVEKATEVDCEPLDFPNAVEAAADDLASVAAFLDQWADNLGDGPERHEIRLSVAVLDAVPVIAAQVAALRRHAGQARDSRAAGTGGQPVADAPGQERPGEIDLPALREVFARQLLPEMRQGLETVLREVLRLTREASVVAESIPGGMDRELAAVAVDLRHLERYLRVVGEADGQVLDRWESRLADVAEARAGALAGVADVLETALTAVAAEADQ